MKEKSPRNVPYLYLQQLTRVSLFIFFFFEMNDVSGVLFVFGHVTDTGVGSQQGLCRDGMSGQVSVGTSVDGNVRGGQRSSREGSCSVYEQRYGQREKGVSRHGTCRNYESWVALLTMNLRWQVFSEGVSNHRGMRKVGFLLYPGLTVSVCRFRCLSHHLRLGNQKTQGKDK